jgi:Na+:H+ antiporter
MLDERMLNAVLVLMLVTSILGPVLTERFAPRMLEADARERDISTAVNSRSASD